MKKWLYIFSCFLLSATLCLAQGEKGVTVSNKEKDLPTGKTWAVVVGISDYQNISKLSFAHKDAEAFYNYLRTPQINVPKENIKLLLNKEAISGEIYGTLEWLAESVKENDKVIFYFSGHGDVEKKTIHQNGFLLAYDAPTAAYMTKGTVSIKFLQDYLETYIANNKAKEVLLIVDACKSGKLAGGMEGIKMTMQALGKEWSGQITKILSAQEGELSLENPKWGGGRGVFSYYLMKGIQGLANRNMDNVITAGELALYLPIKVGDETANSQNPKIDGDAKRQLFTFDNVLLADAKKDELLIPSGQMIAANTKGFGDEVSPAVMDAYAKYNEFIKKGWLLWGNKEADTINCALHIYRDLINKPEAISIKPSLKSTFLTALQKRSQNKLDDYLKGIPDLFVEKDMRAIREIMFASTIIDKGHILYNYINARALFFNSLLIDDHLKAVEVLKSALKLEDDAAYLYNRIGLRYADADEVDSAIYYYEKAKELAPKWPFPYNNLGIQYTAKKQLDKALLNAEQGISINPNYAGIYNVTGMIYEEKGELDKALTFYKKSIVLDSLQFHPNLNMAKVLLKQGKYETALNFALKAAALNPKEDDAFNEIGRNYQELHQYEEAIKYYKKAFEINPSEVVYLRNLGHVYYNLERYEEALPIYKKVIKIDPSDKEGWDSIVDTYNAMIKSDEILAYFREYIKTNNDSFYPYFKLARAYLAEGNRTEALKYYEKVLKFKDYYPMVLMEMAEIYVELNNLTKGYAFAIKAAELNEYDSYPFINKGLNSNAAALLTAYQFYTDSLSPKPSNDRYYLKVGNIYLANKQYKNALATFEKGIAVNNSNLDALYLDAITAALYLKEYKKAISIGELRISKYPSYYKSYYLLASVYSLLNDLPNAVKYFSLAIEKGYDDPAQVNADPNLINLRKSAKFKELMKMHFPKN